MEETPEAFVVPAQNSSKKSFFTIIILLVLAILVISGYFLYQQYRASQEKKDILRQINKIEEAILNPDQKLLAKYKISDQTIKAEQNIIIYGGDPKSIIEGRNNPPDSLEGIKKTLEMKNFSQANKRSALKNLRRIFDQASSPRTGKDGKNDSVVWDKKTIGENDPKNLLISGEFAMYQVSRIKENATREIIKLGYMFAE